MDIFYGFKVCRLCLKPGTKVELSSMFEGNGEIVEAFQKVGGIDISQDCNKNDALICKTCCPILMEVAKFHESINRDGSSSIKSEDNGASNIVLCRFCLVPSTIANLRVLRVSKFTLLKQLTGVDMKKEETIVCRHCSMFVEKTFNIREDIKETETFYFIPRREENNALDEKSTIVSDKSAKKAKLEIKPKRKIRIQQRSKEKTAKGQINVTNIGKKSKDSKTIAKNFKCKICNKYFVTSRVLKEHLERVHAKIKNFFCDICGYSDYLKANLQAHMVRRHINPTIKPRRFYDSNRPFKCTVKGCPKFFTTSHNLDLHLQIHSGQKSYVCHCGKKFTFQFELNGHRRRHHSKSSDLNESD